MLKKLALPICLLPLLSACGDPPETRAGQPVTHRQAAFRELLKTSEPMGLMLRANRYDPTEFKRLADQLMSQRDAPWAYFEADTLYAPSKAKAEVWSEPEKFAERKKALFDATEQISAAAASGNKEQVALAYKALDHACVSCHDTFKRK